MGETGCLWCGKRTEYKLLIRRRGESSYRHAIGFEVCSGHGGVIGRQLIATSDGKGDKDYLLGYLWPRVPYPPENLPVAWTRP